jgi:hypothetical protein
MSGCQDRYQRGKIHSRRPKRKGPVVNRPFLAMIALSSSRFS